MAVFDVAIVEAVAGQGGAGGRDAAVLEQVEAWRRGDARGGAGARGWVKFGERLHGREDQSQAISHVFVGRARQSWGVAWWIGKNHMLSSSNNNPDRLRRFLKTCKLPLNLNTLTLCNSYLNTTGVMRC